MQFLSLFSFSYWISSELDLYYRWEINNNVIYPTEYINLFARTDFCIAQINIEPSYGTFRPNSRTSFKVLVRLTNIFPGQYRSNLQ
jgi:hypothetical protein